MGAHWDEEITEELEGFTLANLRDMRVLSDAEIDGIARVLHTTVHALTGTPTERAYSRRSNGEAVSESVARGDLANARTDLSVARDVAREALSAHQATKRQAAEDIHEARQLLATATTPTIPLVWNHAVGVQSRAQREYASTRDALERAQRDVCECKSAVKEAQRAHQTAHDAAALGGVNVCH